MDSAAGYAYQTVGVTFDRAVAAKAPVTAAAALVPAAGGVNSVVKRNDIDIAAA